MATVNAHARKRLDEEEGVVLSPEDEAELEQAIAESDEDERAGRLYPAAEILASLRGS